MGPKSVQHAILKSDPGRFRMLKQVVLAHCEARVTHFYQSKIAKCLEHWSFWNQNWVKTGSMTCFSPNDPELFRMLKQVFSAHSDPVLTEFSPFGHMYAPRCVLRTYLRAVWWSHGELGRGV